MNALLDALSQLDSFERLLADLKTPERRNSLGLSRAARLPVLAALYQADPRPLLLLVTKTTSALTLVDELAFWLPDVPRFLFPEPTSLFYEKTPWGHTTRRERIQILTHLVAEQVPGAPRLPGPPVIIAPARALMARTLPRREFIKATLNLKTGQSAGPLQLAKSLASAGYQSANTVVMPGQFARRGGILDIWVQGDEQPVRLDFFGDEVETIREFDPSTQLSAGRRERLLLPPACEFLPDAAAFTLSESEEWSEFHLPLLHRSPASLLDYLPRDARVMVDDRQSFDDTLDALEEQALTLRSSQEADGQLPPDYPLPYLTRPEIGDLLSARQTIELGPAGGEDAAELAYAFIPEQRFGGQIQECVDHIHRAQARGDEVVVISRQAARLQELYEQGLTDLLFPAPRFKPGSLSEGWLLTAQSGRRIHLLTDSEIFGWRRPQPRQRRRETAETPEALYPDFQLGDFVVHVDYGIGRFQGMVRRTLEGSEQEYLSVEYANGDVLYVPIHQADRLGRYIGARGHRPAVTRLGGVEWHGIKSRVRRAVEEVAQDLLELYARRQVSAGFSFNADTPWQKELEASFPYVETEDQLRVLADVKQDMQAPRPMDRLICGDVGYGKTEVALRAAFKAAQDGKQVAVLVPTTILAQQHFRTFRQRLAAFPAQVEMLSRFRSPAEQREILRRLALGSVDIIIGTHRLLQPDVVFKDLGLLVIDEEQRFGVTHKEFLKQMRTEVDVLTLTATPIPRTLYMALTGARDISTIDTPPEERLPIATHVGPYSSGLVRQAILRELERGGQVFFVHNRVQTIAGIQRQVSELVPEARVAIAHGQMPEKELEQRMREFTSGEIDVLFSTSIIESGLDIPNANTLIVDRADTFGLAQLYQLRGRVGRGAQRAYAYFFQHRTRQATEDGRARLDTIAENTHLGAGFNIAMRDLEIRGAGDFLGTRQHGHIAAVGLNLYTRLLSQAIQEIKEHGRLSADHLPRAVSLFHPLVNVDLPLGISIPEEYIPDTELRLRLYRRLADTHDPEEAERLRTEFTDRFGPPPQPVENLFFHLKVKALAEQCAVVSVTAESQQIVIRFPARREGAPPRKFPALPPPARGGKNAIWLTMDETNWPDDLLKVLTALVETPLPRNARND
ncbi:MAG: transcription-repair coupling factor [Chloroflexi bacterium]|nr:transcription-repair coupling factor [Chloroflexota bacterium]